MKIIERSWIIIDLNNFKYRDVMIGDLGWLLDESSWM